jgi:hypothetical protein
MTATRYLDGPRTQAECAQHMAPASHIPSQTDGEPGDVFNIGTYLNIGLQSLVELAGPLARQQRGNAGGRRDSQTLCVRRLSLSRQQ